MKIRLIKRLKQKKRKKTERKKEKRKEVKGNLKSPVDKIRLKCLKELVNILNFAGKGAGEGLEG